MSDPLKASFNAAAAEPDNAGDSREKERATARHLERLSFFITHLDALEKTGDDGVKLFTCKRAADAYGFYMKVYYKEQRDLDFTVYGEPLGNIRVYRHDVTEIYHNGKLEADMSRLRVMNMKTNDEVLAELSLWISKVATPEEIMSLSDPSDIRLPRAKAKYKI